jgi:hypothetical protein
LVCSAKGEPVGSPRYRPAASSLIGSVRANPVAAPAAPNGNFPHFEIYILKELFLMKNNALNIPHGRRWGADRICPNVSDEE